MMTDNDGGLESYLILTKEERKRALSLITVF